MNLEAWINSELQKYLKTSEGKEVVNQAISSGKFVNQQKASSEEAISVLKECICNFAPPGFSSPETLAPIQQMVDGAVSSPVQTDNGWEVAVNFNQESLQRPSLWGSSAGAYDIIGLFSQGWDIDESKKVPVGIWHGQKIVALRHRPGRPFVEDAVNFFMATYADKYGVSDIDVNPLYGEWGI